MTPSSIEIEAVKVELWRRYPMPEGLTEAEREDYTTFVFRMARVIALQRMNLPLSETTGSRNYYLPPITQDVNK